MSTNELSGKSKTQLLREKFESLSSSGSLISNNESKTASSSSLLSSFLSSSNDEIALRSRPWNAELSVEIDTEDADVINTKTRSRTPPPLPGRLSNSKKIHNHIKSLQVVYNNISDTHKNGPPPLPPLPSKRSSELFEKELHQSSLDQPPPIPNRSYRKKERENCSLSSPEMILYQKRRGSDAITKRVNEDPYMTQPPSILSSPLPHTFPIRLDVWTNPAFFPKTNSLSLDIPSMRNTIKIPLSFVPIFDSLILWNEKLSIWQLYLICCHGFRCITLLKEAFDEKYYQSDSFIHQSKIFPCSSRSNTTKITNSFTSPNLVSQSNHSSDSLDSHINNSAPTHIPHHKSSKITSFCYSGKPIPFFFFGDADGSLWSYSPVSHEIISIGHKIHQCHFYSISTLPEKNGSKYTTGKNLKDSEMDKNRVGGIIGLWMPTDTELWTLDGMGNLYIWSVHNNTESGSYFCEREWNLKILPKTEESNKNSQPSEGPDNSPSLSSLSITERSSIISNYLMGRVGIIQWGRSVSNGKEKASLWIITSKAIVIIEPSHIYSRGVYIDKEHGGIDETVDHSPQVTSLYLNRETKLEIGRPSSITFDSKKRGQSGLIYGKIIDLAATLLTLKVGAIRSISFCPLRNWLVTGHEDGKIVIWQRKLINLDQEFFMEPKTVLSVTLYKISAIQLVFLKNTEYCFIWIGLITGKIIVVQRILYKRSEKWLIMKEWVAHESSVLSFDLNDDSSIISSTSDKGKIRLWDPTLSEDRKGRLFKYLLDSQKKFCEWTDYKTLILSWNINGNKITESMTNGILTNIFNSETIRDVDMVIVGWQEMIDLGSKSQSARSFFKPAKNSSVLGKTGTTGKEDESKRVRAWNEALTTTLNQRNDYSNETDFELISGSGLVGLYMGIWIRKNKRPSRLEVQTAVVKTGLGGRHGNKGSILVEIIMDDTSILICNAHLAAGPSHTSQRNTDASLIIKSPSFSLPAHSGKREEWMDLDLFEGGIKTETAGVLDHSVIIFFGDLNYRIQEFSYEDVTRMLSEGTDERNLTENLIKLWSMDQLVLQRRLNPLFVLSNEGFHECMKESFYPLSYFENENRETNLSYPPTYKYDIGSDHYDTSEKKRIPSWTDRILIRDQRIRRHYQMLWTGTLNEQKELSKEGERMKNDISTNEAGVKIESKASSTLNHKDQFDITSTESSISGNSIGQNGEIDYEKTGFKSVDSSRFIKILNPVGRRECQESDHRPILAKILLKIKKVKEPKIVQQLYESLK